MIKVVHNIMREDKYDIDDHTYEPTDYQKDSDNLLCFLNIGKIE